MLMQVSLPLAASISTPGAWGGRVGKISAGVVLAWGFGLGVLVGAGVRVGFGVLVGVAVCVGFGVLVDTAVAVGFGVFDGAAT